MFVSLGGASNGGKTTVAAAVAAARPHTIVLAQDDYYRTVDAVPVTTLPAREAGATPVVVPDWDCVGALDPAGLAAAVQARLADPAAYCPACTGDAKAAAAAAAHVLLLEGTLLFDPALALPVAPAKAFLLDAPASLCRTRRVARACVPCTPCMHACMHVSSHGAQVRRPRARGLF